MTKFMKNNACCYNGGGDDDTLPNDCIDKWKDQLEDVCNQYNEFSAKTAQSREEYINSKDWETKLKSWDTIIKKTDEKAKVIVKELEFFLEQTKIVCENSKCSVEGTEKLIGLVKSIFDTFFTYDQNKAGLKERIADFKKAIECLKHIDDEDKVEVLKCIETYEQKIALVCEMQEKILTHLLETLKQVNLLASSICAQGGLEEKLKMMLELFKGDGQDDDCDGGHGDEHSAKQGENGYAKYPCDDTKVKMMPKFPIDASLYYNNLEQDLKKAEEQTLILEESWAACKKDSDKILSHKTSLQEAIKAAEAAEKC